MGNLCSKKHMTLMEMLVAITISSVIFTGVYALFDSGQKAFQFANLTGETSGTITFTASKFEDSFQGKYFGDVEFWVKKSANNSFFEAFENYGSAWSAQSIPVTHNNAALTENGFCYYNTDIQQGFSLYKDDNTIVYGEKDSSGYRSSIIAEAENTSDIDLKFTYYDNTWTQISPSAVNFETKEVKFIECIIKLFDGVSTSEISCNAAINK